MTGPLSNEPGYDYILQGLATAAEKVLSGELVSADDLFVITEMR